MKVEYLKIILLALLAVVAIQAYYLYDLKREGIASEKEALPLSLVPAPAPKDLRPFSDLFDKAQDPFAQMQRLQKEMEESFRDLDHLFQNDSSFEQLFSRTDRTPRFDMKEHKGRYIITMEIPGSDKHSIEVKAKEGRLSISSKVMEEVEDNATTYFRHERRASSYKREIMLPSDADEGSLRTEYKDGLLVITIDKQGVLDI